MKVIVFNVAFKLTVDQLLFHEAAHDHFDLGILDQEHVVVDDLDLVELNELHEVGLGLAELNDLAVGIYQPGFSFTIAAQNFFGAAVV